MTLHLLLYGQHIEIPIPEKMRSVYEKRLKDAALGPGSVISVEDYSVVALHINGWRFEADPIGESPKRF